MFFWSLPHLFILLTVISKTMERMGKVYKDKIMAIEVTPKLFKSQDKERTCAL